VSSAAIDPEADVAAALEEHDAKSGP
jgi:hypothetical protein